MRSLLTHALTLALAAAGLSACIIRDDHPPTPPGDRRTQSALRFEVSLDGYGCEDVPEVAKIHVHVEGEGMPVDLDVGCPQTGERIYVPGFFPGAYTWRLSALDANGYLLYESQGSVNVFEESPLVTADLAPADVDYGLLLFHWGFGPGLQRCGEAGVRDVKVTIGHASFTMPCAPDSIDEGAAFEVPPGIYTWSLVARGSDQDLIYTAEGDLDIRAGETVDVNAILTPHVVPPDPGELTVFWTFNGTANCAVYEIENVYVQLWSGSDPLLGEDELGVKLPCSDQGVTIQSLTPGTYFLDLRGEGREAGHDVILFEALDFRASVESAMATEVKVDLHPL